MLTIHNHMFNDSFYLEKSVVDETSWLQKTSTLTHRHVYVPSTDGQLKVTAKTNKSSYTNLNKLDIELFDHNNSRIAQLILHVPNPSTLDDVRLGLLEGLLVARFASETTRSVIGNTEHPTPKHLDELLTIYAGVKIVFENDFINPRNEIQGRPVVPLSGGIDSTALLCQYQGQCDALTIAYGQSSFAQGIWNEKQSVKALCEIFDKAYDTSINLTYGNHAFKIFKHLRMWSKSFNNLFLGVHGSILCPDQPLLLGIQRDDTEHDCNAELIDGFRELTGIPLYAPQLEKSRMHTTEQVIKATVDKLPYLYASTQSCEQTHFYGTTHIFCGACQSCLLRLAAIPHGVDPRFQNFNPDIHIIPEQLQLTVDRVWKESRYAWKAFNGWWSSLTDDQQDDFSTCISFVRELETKLTSKAISEENFLPRRIKEKEEREEKEKQEQAAQTETPSDNTEPIKKMGDNIYWQQTIAAVQLQVQQHGVYGQETSYEGACYVDAQANVYANEGTTCEKCYFYKGDKLCSVVKGWVQEGGY